MLQDTFGIELSTQLRGSEKRDEQTSDADSAADSLAPSSSVKMMGVPILMHCSETLNIFILGRLYCRTVI